MGIRGVTQGPAFCVDLSGDPPLSYTRRLLPFAFCLASGRVAHLDRVTEVGASHGVPCHFGWAPVSVASMANFERIDFLGADIAGEEGRVVGSKPEPVPERSCGQTRSLQTPALPVIGVTSAIAGCPHAAIESGRRA